MNSALPTPHSALLPCPFCGANPNMEHTDSFFWVECGCGAEGPTIGARQGAALAAELWNRRAPNPAHSALPTPHSALP